MKRVTLRTGEKLLEVGAPSTPKGTLLQRLTLPKSIRMRCKSRRRTNFETPAEPAQEPDESLWTMLPFAEGTWRSTYRVRAVPFANDVDSRVQEVLDLPVLNLAAAQDEDPDLVFMKELLRDHDVRPSWYIVREESAEVKILWTQVDTSSRSRKMSYTAGEKKLQPTPNGKWGPPSLSDPRFLRHATITPWLPIKE